MFPQVRSSVHSSLMALASLPLDDLRATRLKPKPSFQDIPGRF
jgi:hypothetical protein